MNGYLMGAGTPFPSTYRFAVELHTEVRSRSSLAKVEESKKFVEVFAEKFDAKVRDEIERVMGTAHW
jgi:hypothetical protein